MGIDFLKQRAKAFNMRRSQRLCELADQRLFEAVGTAKRVLKAHWLDITQPVLAGTECLLRYFNGQVRVFVGLDQIAIVNQPPEDVVETLIHKGYGICPAVIDRVSELGETLDIQLR